MIESHASTSGISSSGGSGTRSIAPGLSIFSARSSTSPISSGGTTASTMPWAKRFSAVWTPSGNGSPYSASKTRGPRKPTRAPGSATVMCPSDPHDAITPPVVGWRT